MDHSHEPLAPANPEHGGVTDFWKLVDQVCERHGISSVHENPAQGLTAMREIIR